MFESARQLRHIAAEQLARHERGCCLVIHHCFELRKPWDVALTYLNVGLYGDARRTAATSGVDMTTLCCVVTRIDIIVMLHDLYKTL